MKKKRISVESLEKRCKNFADTHGRTREAENLPPMSNSERLELMAMLAKSLEEKYEIVEETEGDKNGV